MTTLLGILQHALGRDQYGRGTDYRNHYCVGSGPDLATCREAVSQGLMTEHPPSEISGGDFVFVVTEAGKAFVTARSPRPPKVSRAKARYLRFINADCGLTFGEWLKRGGDQWSPLF